MDSRLPDTDGILNLMRTFRNDGVVNTEIFLDLNSAFGEHFSSDNVLVQSRLQVIAHVINAYMPIVYSILENEGKSNYIKKFYDEKVTL